MKQEELTDAEAERAVAGAYERAKGDRVLAAALTALREAGPVLERDLEVQLAMARHAAAIRVIHERAPTPMKAPDLAGLLPEGFGARWEAAYREMMAAAPGSPTLTIVPKGDL